MRKLIVLAAVTMAMAAFGLAFSAAAQAAPPDPVTLGATTLSNIRLNGVPGTQLVVAPGTNVTITADWVDNNTGCPGCIDNLPVAFQGFGAQPAGCIEEISGLGGSGTGTVALGAVPTTQGTYNIVGNFEETFFCGQFWTVPNAFPVIAEVVVPDADDNEQADDNDNEQAEDNDNEQADDNDDRREERARGRHASDDRPARPSRPERLHAQGDDEEEHHHDRAGREEQGEDS